MQTFRIYFMSDTKKNKKVLKILKKEGLISYFYSREKKIKIFLKQDNTNYFNLYPFVKTLRNKQMFTKKNEIWKSHLKPGVFLLNTTIGIIPERVTKRKFKGGCILTYTR